MEMCSIVDRNAIPPVDEWGIDPKYPIAPEDIIFKNIKGDIILPIAEFFGNTDEESQQINYFAMSPKRSYNSDKTRDHICQYLNHFEKYYDHDRELLMYMYRIKYLIDYNKKYSRENFMDDVNIYIIRNPSLTRKIKHFVSDNYQMNLSNNGGRTPNLQFNNNHAKILYEVSLMMNIYIPMATHYMYMNFIKKSEDVIDFMRTLYDMCVTKYVEEENIDVHQKIYETALSVVNKSRNPNKTLWDKNRIRGNNATTHTHDSVDDIILQIMPKYVYNSNIVNFNYFSNRRSISYKITDIEYEYTLNRLSSSERDADQNSEFDRYESKISKKDEALAMQNKVAAEMAILDIEATYGPYSEKEIAHYKKMLTKDGSGVINPTTNKLLGYIFYQNLGDPETWKSIPNQIHYIKLMIAAKRKLKALGMVILPYLISSKVSRISSRKVINKNNTNEIKNATLWNEFRKKYNNPKVEAQFFELLGTIKSSQFEMIDWDEENDCPTEYDGINAPMIDDMIDEEFLSYVICI